VTVSLPSSTKQKSGGPYRKPTADVYTACLVISLIAILLGILVLYLEMKSYQFEFDGAPRPASAMERVVPVRVAAMPGPPSAAFCREPSPETAGHGQTRGVLEPGSCPVDRPAALG
jgi:hypothetical protein